jgi:hypothetical protein
MFHIDVAICNYMTVEWVEIRVGNEVADNRIAAR